MATSQGAQAQMAMDSALPFDTSSEPFEFISETLTSTTEVVDTGGLRATRSRTAERTRSGVQRISGTIEMEPTSTELDNLLPRILGSSESSADNFQVAETLPTFVIMIDRVGKVFTFNGCVVSRATFSSSEGGPLKLSMDIEATSQSVSAAGGFPAITPSNTSPFMHMDGVLTMGMGKTAGTAYKFQEIETVIDNVVNADRFMNSVTRADIPAQDRIVTVRTVHPYTSAETGLYAQQFGGAGATWALTNGTVSTKFTFAKLQVTEEAANVPGRTEILLALTHQAFASGEHTGFAQKEIEVESDSVV